MFVKFSFLNVLLEAALRSFFF